MFIESSNYFLDCSTKITTGSGFFFQLAVRLALMPLYDLHKQTSARSAVISTKLILMPATRMIWDFRGGRGDCSAHWVPKINKIKLLCTLLII